MAYIISISYEVMNTPAHDVGYAAGLMNCSNIKINAWDAGIYLADSQLAEKKKIGLKLFRHSRREVTPLKNISPM